MLTILVDYPVYSWATETA